MWDLALRSSGGDGEGFSPVLLHTTLNTQPLFFSPALHLHRCHRRCYLAARGAVGRSSGISRGRCKL